MGWCFPLPSYSSFSPVRSGACGGTGLDADRERERAEPEMREPHCCGHCTLSRGVVIQL